MLGSPALSRKRPFELLSDLVDDGGFGEDLQPQRWDVSALDEMSRFTKLGLGVGAELLAYSEEAVLLGRWGRSCEEAQEELKEQEERTRVRGSRLTAPAADQEGKCSAGAAEGGGGVSVGTQEGEDPVLGGAGGYPSRQRTVEVYQVAQEEEEEEAAATGLAVEHCNEEHNYSLSQGEELGVPERHGSQHEEEQEDEEQAELEPPGGESSLSKSQHNTEDKEQQQLEEDEEEDEEEGEETAVEEAELSSSSESECGESHDQATRL